VKILNFGSLNIDHVYRVPHLVKPGETLTSNSLETFAGGKGANQSTALAKAGASPAHAGKVGEDGRRLIDKLSDAGVDTSFIRVDTHPTGHAIIQVDDNGQNSIVLFPGGNRQIQRGEIDATLEHFECGDILLLQNEINEIPYIMDKAHSRKMKICFNPAPFSPEIRRYPLDLVDIMVINETEGAGISETEDPERILDTLSARFPSCQILLTLGSDGVMFRSGSTTINVPAVKVKAVDTTAAGDTFIGFYLAKHMAGADVELCLRTACAAAAISVSRPGASDSIPTIQEVEP
jgi:ribokinase